MENYFELYNIPISFSPNKEEVKRQYFALSKKYHPDFVVNGTTAEKEEALEISSAINNAYKIFNNEDETIQYVLQLKGVLEQDEKYELPKDFLIEMMELNEELMDAKLENDTTKIDNLKQTITHIQHLLFNDIKNVIEAQTIENINIEDLKRAKEYYFKKKYITRILDSIN